MDGWTIRAELVSYRRPVCQDLALVLLLGAELVGLSTRLGARSCARGGARPGCAVETTGSTGLLARFLEVPEPGEVDLESCEVVSVNPSPGSLVTAESFFSAGGSARGSDATFCASSSCVPARGAAIADAAAEDIGGVGEGALLVILRWSLGCTK